MKIILLILIIFSSSIAFSSDGLDALDGKNIICESINEPIYPTVGIYGFRFVGNEVSGDYFVIGNDEVKIVNFYTDFVKTISIDTIIWWGSESFTGWELNRETLYLVFDADSSPHQCKVVLNIDVYNKEMELIRLEQFNILKEKLKKNKI